MVCFVSSIDYFVTSSLHELTGPTCRNFKGGGGGGGYIYSAAGGVGAYWGKGNHVN